MSRAVLIWIKEETPEGETPEGKKKTDYLQKLQIYQLLIFSRILNCSNIYTEHCTPRLAKTTLLVSLLCLYVKQLYSSRESLWVRKS